MLVFLPYSISHFVLSHTHRFIQTLSKTSIDEAASERNTRNSCTHISNSCDEINDKFFVVDFVSKVNSQFSSVAESFGCKIVLEFRISTVLFELVWIRYRFCAIFKTQKYTSICAQTISYMYMHSAAAPYIYIEFTHNLYARQANEKFSIAFCCGKSAIEWVCVRACLRA